VLADDDECIFVRVMRILILADSGPTPRPFSAASFTNRNTNAVQPDAIRATAQVDSFNATSFFR
jgi:hypothetical protein